MLAHKELCRRDPAFVQYLSCKITGYVLFRETGNDAGMFRYDFAQALGNMLQVRPQFFFGYIVCQVVQAENQYIFIRPAHLLPVCDSGIEHVQYLVR